MLGKLMKYDFRCMLRKFGPLWIGLIGLAAINGFTVGHVLENKNMDGILAFLLGGLPVVLLFALWVATGVMMIVFVCERFYKGLLGDEGYLMFTLPATPAEHIASKLIVALVMELITALVALLGMFTFVMIYDASGFMAGLRELGEIMARLNIPRGVPGIIASLAVLSVVSAVATDLQIYQAISLGHLAKKNRVAMSVIAFVGINLALSMVISFIGRLFGSVNVNVTLETFDETMEMLVSYGTKALWALIAWSVLKSVGFFFGTDLILSKKLNLE